MGSRVVAFIIDLLCLQIVTVFLINLGLGIVYTIFENDFAMLLYWQSLLLYLVYFVGFAVFNHSQTVGKMVLGLKVLQMDYEELSEFKRLIREVLKALFMPISIISFLIALLHPEHKSLHDLLLDSVVVKERRYVKNPYNTSNDGKAKEQNDNLEGFNLEEVDNQHKFKSKKEYVDPLDENYEIDDDEI